MGIRSLPVRRVGRLADADEDRALPARDSQPAFPPLTYASAPLERHHRQRAARRDAYACVRVLADSISTLPLHAYRRTDQGRVPAGDNARVVQLLNRPAPGSTGVDLISQIMVHLNVHGEAFVGKYRADGEIVQLGLIPPDSVQVELRGQRIVYMLDTLHGRTEHGPDDVLHIKGMSARRAARPVPGDAVPGGARPLLEPAAVARKVFTEQGRGRPAS